VPSAKNNKRQAFESPSAHDELRDRRTIRNECARGWPDDLQIRNFCEEKQLEALAKVGR
jgi:hypothetical protein